jgi:Fic family protein
MSKLNEKFQKIELIRQEIESLGKLSMEVLRKIEYQYRLECNYHSNRIEGGTLTKPETRSIMIGNITVDGKPLKDIREMAGHDSMMLQIQRIGQNELRLSPTRIKEIHQTIIVEENPEKQKDIGNWKTANNEIINTRLEKYSFTPFDEVPEKMQQLVNWLNAGLDKFHGKTKNAPHPILLAFEFHLRFLTIHPFMDGNGRTARMLTNIILISCGYPVFWVSEGGEKEAYNRYLTDIQSYGGEPDLLYEFLVGLLLRSYQLVLDTCAKN